MRLNIQKSGLFNDDAYWRNHQKVKDGEMPCLLCGKGVNMEKSGVKMFWLHGGGSHIITTKQDADELGGESADMYGYPIGPECYRKHKDILEPFTHIEEM